MGRDGTGTGSAKMIMPITAVLIALTLLIAPEPVGSQEPTATFYREYLGSREEGLSLLTTPRYGIQVDSGGFEVPRWGRERKSENYARKQGIPEYLITSYCDDAGLMGLRCFANDLWTDQKLLTWTDKAWEESGAVNFGIDPRTVVVRVEATAFYVAETNDYRGAWYWGNNRVSVLIFYIGHHAGVDGWQDFNYKNECNWAFGIMTGQHR